MPKRPPIPADLEREILTEAGHRCAIHTCRQTPIELAHITPYSRCKEHRYEDLVALCPTCHTRFDRGEIDRRSMIAYKARLLLYMGRFCAFELRLLRKLQMNGQDEIWLLDGLELMISGLLESNYLIEAGGGEAIASADAPTRKLYRLTSAGKEFVLAFLS